jgi:microsomal dipeptidase-like Zn-dependent dipeptidase
MQAPDEAGKPAARVPLGGDYWQSDPGTPLWGFADTHAHLMAHLAFGGRAFWGQPYDPEHPGDDGIQYALGSCAPIHGGLLNVNPEFGHPAGGGWPEFIIWPRFTTLVHQQAYVDWLYRAYQGGLRLISCLAVNNELLANRASPGEPQDDRSAIAVQIAGMKQMAAHIAKNAADAARPWLQMAYSPEEARQIIEQDRLAVILGVEVDSLGNWHSHEELDRLSRSDPQQARALIAAEIDWLYHLGVRQITPIHLTDNAFGGTAIYMRFLETVNLFVAGHRYEVEDAWETGVRYRLDHDGDDFVDGAERLVALSGARQRQKPAMHRRTLIDHVPGVEKMVEATEAPNVRGGHANARGLTIYGEMVLEEMMARGMIIDVDHMSQKATDRALTMAEARDYPVILSHSWFRDLLFTADAEYRPQTLTEFLTGDVHKVAHEAGKRGDQVDRIAALGGLVAPILNQGDIAGLERVLPELAGKTGPECAGSSTSWAQAYLYAAHKMGGRGVAIGSDINGAAGLPAPRFGPLAAYGAHGDPVRTQVRRAQIDRQANGVRYAEPVRDFRCCRFPPSGPGAYDDEERLIWRAIAEYKAGFDPWFMEHTADEVPHPGVLEHLGVTHTKAEQDRADNIVKGLWAGHTEQAAFDVPDVRTWPAEQQAAYLARQPDVELDADWDGHILVLAHRVRAIWERWQATEGDNAPLKRCTAGPQRDYDINIDGMAHYGMLPDLLQDLRNVGLTQADLAPLFRSANDYVEMWEKCRACAQAATTTEQAPGKAPTQASAG